MIPLTNPEIDTLEKQLGVIFPSLYRKLLVEVGCGKDGDCEIYHPERIRDLYQYHFEDAADLFGNYFPFGCNNRKQEIWLIRPKVELAASIWHETHPDDYDGEEWLGYQDWIEQHHGQLPCE